jgi:hypothetical protein
MFSSSQLFLSMFQLIVSVIGATAVTLGALYYFRRVRLERPAIGRFNGRDVLFLFSFLTVLPLIYVVIPRWALMTLLIVTFAAALSIGFGPVIPKTWLWLGIGVLIGADLWMGQRMIDAVSPWHWVWAENSVVVLLAAISVANLYVQGGMKLRHVAWFAGGLAIYDAVFTFVWPVSNLLVRAFVNYPLFPAVGMRIGYDEAVVGLGDLLVYGGFTIAAFKAYGRPGLRVALPLVLVFGAVVPSLSGLVINYVDSVLDVVIPAQTWFGPAAVIAYLWMRRRYGRERTTKEYLASIEVGRREPPDDDEVAEAPEVETRTAILSG